jgi:hypothetical protein
LWARDGGSSKVDWPDMLSGIFFAQGLDRKLVICPSGRLKAPSVCHCKERLVRRTSTSEGGSDEANFTARHSGAREA